MRIGCRRDYRGLRVPILSSSAASWRATSGPNSEASKTWQISITSSSDAGQREAHSIASSFDVAWIIQ